MSVGDVDRSSSSTAESAAASMPSTSSSSAGERQRWQCAGGSLVRSSGANETDLGSTVASFAVHARSASEAEEASRASRRRASV